MERVSGVEDVAEEKERCQFSRVGYGEARQRIIVVFWGGSFAANVHPTLTRKE